MDEENREENITISYCFEKYLKYEMKLFIGFRHGDFIYTLWLLFHLIDDEAVSDF